jgi:hypothetical protein
MSASSRTTHRRLEGKRAMKLLLFPLLLLCTSSSPAQTVDVITHKNAIELRDLCRELIGPNRFEHPLDAGHCTGYIQGAVDGLNLAPTVWKVPASVKACVPQGTTTEELVRVFLKFIDSHPQKLSYAAANVVWQAIIASYPCPAKTSP